MADKKYPQVLLLGNGINRAFGSDSWSELLKELRNSEEKCDEENKNNAGQSLPFPLQAIFITNDNIGERLKEIQKDPSRKNLLYGSLKNSEHICMLQNILNMGFDHILTTNYSYELESAALKKFPCASDWAIEQLQDYTPGIKKAEPKYLLHTYNAVSQNEIENQIWHIHGEARKYNSIILGHYYYASLVFKYKELLDRRGYRYAHENITHFYNKSWLDAFILSDVYILGFDFDPSEFDLWWLLNRKKRERVEHGKVFYYSPDHDGDKSTAQRYEDKIGLLKDMEVEICNLGFDFHYFENFTDDRSNHYREFYKKAIEDISRRVEKARR